MKLCFIYCTSYFVIFILFPAIADLVGGPKYRRIMLNEENVNIVEIQVDRVDTPQEKVIH